MLHCNAVMKVTNDEKGIFPFYSHDINKKSLLRAISITVDLLFPSKALTVNIVKFFIGFDTLFLEIFRTKLPIYAL